MPSRSLAHLPGPVLRSAGKGKGKKGKGKGKGKGKQEEKQWVPWSHQSLSRDDGRSMEIMEGCNDDGAIFFRPH